MLAGLVAGCTLTGTGAPVADTMVPGGPSIPTRTDAAGGVCAPGQIELPDGPPAPLALDEPPAPSAEAPDGRWLITDNSAECACALNFSRAILGGNRVAPVGCRHPGLTMTARFAMAGDQLALLAADGETVMYRLRRLGPAHFEGLMNGRAVVLWQPAPGE